MLAEDATGVGKTKLVDGKRDHAVERMESIPVSFVIRIAESGISCAGLEMQRQVDHGAWVAGIKGSRDERLVSREDSRVDADPERQGEHRRDGESGVAEQGARPVTKVEEHGFEQDH